MNILSKYLLLVLLVALGGCSKPQVTAASDSAPVATVETVADRNVVSVDKPERFTTAKVASRMEADQISANGSVAADISKTLAVNSLSSGRVADVRVRLGDDVQKGQVLLTMTSPDMQQGISDYQKFQAVEKLARIQLDRAELLFSKGAYAKKDLEVADDAYRRAKIDTQTTAERIRILGGDPEHPSAVIEIHAPGSGTIIEQNVTAAGGVKSQDNSPNLFTIADLSSVWVLVDIYENDLARVHLGDRVDIELNAYPDRRFRGRVTNISKLLDPTTRSTKVRIELPNENGLLRPNMFAIGHFVSQSANARLVIPAGAALRLQDRDWVYVRLNARQFRKTEVQVGSGNPDKTLQVLSGLHAGDEVITEALLFDRELQKSEP